VGSKVPLSEFTSGRIFLAANASASCSDANGVTGPFSTGRRLVSASKSRSNGEAVEGGNRFKSPLIRIAATASTVNRRALVRKTVLVMVMVMVMMMNDLFNNQQLNSLHLSLLTRNRCTTYDYLVLSG
jgi:hypothetical protein